MQPITSITIEEPISRWLTNFLLLPVQLGFDIYAKFEEIIPLPRKIVIITPIIEELELKRDKYPEKRKFAQQLKMAFQLLNLHPYHKLEVSRSPNELVDDILLNSAINEQVSHPNHKIYLATNDKELRRKCKNAKISCIYLRKLQKLGIDQN